MIVLMKPMGYKLQLRPLPSTTFGRFQIMESLFHAGLWGLLRVFSDPSGYLLVMEPHTQFEDGKQNREFSKLLRHFFILTLKGRREVISTTKVDLVVKVEICFDLLSDSWCDPLFSFLSSLVTSFLVSQK